MQYWIVGGVGAVVVVCLGLLLSRWDMNRHAAPTQKEQTGQKNK